MEKNKEVTAVEAPKRIPVHKSKGLDAIQRPGYKRRWVDDVPGRIDAFKAGGWSPVVGSENNTSDIRAQNETQMSSVVTKVVNRGRDAVTHTAVLMEIPEDLYLQDQADKQKVVDQIEAQYDPTKHKQSGADYGYLNKT